MDAPSPTTHNRDRGRDEVKFRNRPVVVDAVQYTEAVRNAHLLDDAPLPDGLRISSYTIHKVNRVVSWARARIESGKYEAEVALGDWVVKHSDGSIYAMTPEKFAEAYEPVEATT